MKRSAIAAAVAVAAVALGANVALARNWINTSSFPTITSAADYYTAANWADDTPPTHEEGANFHACPDGKWTFITSDRVVDSRSILTCDGTTYGDPRNVVIVSDKGFAMDCPAPSNGLWIGPAVYGNLSAAGRLLTWTATLCGDIASTYDPTDYMGQLTLASGVFYHRLDRYANSSDPVRVNPMNLRHLYMGSSNFSLTAPQSSATDVTGAWNQTENSPYLFPAAGTSHVLPVGTIVTGAGVPPDTFLKRVFPDGSIELSNPIEAGQTIEGNGLTFAAFTPDVRVSVDKLTYASTANQVIYLNKSRKEDSLVFEVGTIYALVSGRQMTVTAAQGTTCASVFRLLSDGGSDGTVNLGIVCLELPSNTVKSLTFALPSSGVTSQVSVPDGAKVRLGAKVTSLKGVLEKVGAGTLQVSCPDAAVVTGSLTVSDGTLELTGPSDAALAVQTLTLAADATLTLTGGELSATSLVVAPGAVVNGTGVLTVPVGTDVSGLTLGDGVALRFKGAEAVVNWSLPATNVPGTPALWIDASREDRITFGANGTDVLRIDDVRGSSYSFASNVASRSECIPQYSRNAILRKLPYVYLRNYGAEPDLGTSGALYWDKPVRGIRAVFFVQEVSITTVCILGSSARLRVGYGDFAIPGGMTWNNEWGVGMVWGSCPCANVLNAPFYQDGEPCKATSRYHAPTTYSSGGNSYVIPTVTEAHPIGTGASADCFGWDNGTRSCGGQRICECIVYTNALTETERLAVLGYLTRKWRQCEPDWTQYPAASGNLGTFDATATPRLAVGDGESVCAATVSGTGDFAKTGAGALTVGEFVHPDGALKVEGGRLTLGSGLDESVFPDGAYLHVDASRTNDVTFSETADGALCVSKWKDARAASDMGLQVYDNQTNYPVLKQVASLGGKHVVDLGRYITTYETWKDQYVSAVDKKACPALRFMKNGAATSIERGLKTGFWILGSENGGGSLVGGGSHSFGEGYGIQRAGGKSANALLRTSDDYKQTYPSWYNAALRDVRVNGVQTDVLATDVLSGDYDLVTFSVLAPFGGTCFGGNHYNWWVGGQALGEVALFREKLASNTIDRVEAYLRAKWFGTETPGFRAAKAKSVTVASGAVLEVKGQPLTASGFSGGGTIEGSLALTADAVLEVVVAENGSVGTVSVTGDIDLSKGGTVRLVGFVKNLTPGEHTLVASPSIAAGSEAGWSVATEVRNRTFALSATAGALKLQVSRTGLAVIVR